MELITLVTIIHESTYPQYQQITKICLVINTMYTNSMCNL